jgi:hypothetical protein
MNFFDFRNWYEEIKNNDYEYIKNRKYYGFRIVFNKKSIFWQEKKIFPIFPWKISFKKIWFQKKNINIKIWLFKQNRSLFKQLKKRQSK